MRTHALLKSLTTVMLMLLLANASLSQWKIPANAPLLTQWSKDVSPSNALPEYPRPQMVRKEWMNLNGLWTYAEAKVGEQPPSGKKLDGTILVPFPIESALSGVMKYTERLWYRRMFTIPRSWSGKRILLHFGAVDWESTVYINGKWIGTHRGGYDPFEFDITATLRKEGEQEIIVGVYDPTDAGEQPRGKQVQQPHGIFYTSTTGIWQTVWIEPVADHHIVDFAVTPDIDSRTLRLKVNAGKDIKGLQVRANAFDGSRLAGSASGNLGSEISIPLIKLSLWSPTDPFLYDLKISLLRNGKVVDEIVSYFGMRKIEIGKDEDGINRILLNDRFVMEVGPLDQGFWPDGIYTAPTDEAMRYDLQTEKNLGFNMVRKHVKVEPDRWYYWADKLGLLVWQDMPSGKNETLEARKQFEVELQRLVQTHRNHPSIIMWVVFNEGWGQYDSARLTALVKSIDPSRLVDNASGWTDMKEGDVNDIHSYPKPKSPEAEERRAIVLGEFGGLGLAIHGHTWQQEHWGYRGMKDQDQLTRQYARFLETVYNLKNNPGLSAAVYTQIADVETECNGLMTYDRAVVKPDLKMIAEVNQGDLSHVPPPPVVVVIVPTSEKEGQRWRFTMETLAEDWFKPEFSDSSWKEGLGGFGTKETPGAIVRTEWKSNDIWIRRDFVLNDTTTDNLYLWMHHDDAAEVYLNGVLAVTAPDWTTEYEQFDISNAAKATLRNGTNTLAIHCNQVTGGQYIDDGLIRVVEQSK